MIKIVKAVVRAVRNELQTGESGWVSTSASDALMSSGYSSKAGQSVTAKSSLEISAAYDCVRKTSQLIGTLPLTMYERTSDGGKRPVETELSDILRHQPNSGQTGVEHWEGQVAAMALKGNSYAEKLKIGNRLVGLRPMFNVTPEADGSNGKLKYAILDRGKKYYLPAEKMFHLRGFGAGDGMGLSAIKYGVNSIGAALAADETAGRVFSNSMMPSGVLTSGQTLTPEQRDQLQAMLSTYAGSSRAGKTLVIEAGLGYKQVQMNPEDAQLLETRRFNVEDVCRWFGVPPIIVGHASEGQTMWGSGIEAIMLSWLTLGINPLLTRIEARILRDLIPAKDQRRYFFEFNREAMLQMDSQAKGDFLLKMRMGGFMSGDEGRDKLNLPRRGGSNDELIVQTSLTPVDLLGKGNS
jgi:HK97 family phage portal protein